MKHDGNGILDLGQGDLRSEDDSLKKHADHTMALDAVMKNDIPHRSDRERHLTHFKDPRLQKLHEMQDLRGVSCYFTTFKSKTTTSPM